jgi:hypothetical protein
MDIFLHDECIVFHKKLVIIQSAWSWILQIIHSVNLKNKLSYILHVKY